MANNGEKNIMILILKPSYFIIKGSRMWPDDAKWKNIYILSKLDSKELMKNCHCFKNCDVM